VKSKCTLLIASLFVFLVGSITAPSVTAENASGKQPGADADLAQELNNPLADLMTVPIQMNYDSNIGVQDDGRKLQANIQPVIQFHLNQDWNLITRTILPVIQHDDIYQGAGYQFGLGETRLSLFLSPKKLSSGGVIWGVVLFFLLPTATDDLPGAGKWGAGPTAILLTMNGP
jgi:hypothetical protein